MYVIHSMECRFYADFYLRQGMGIVGWHRCCRISSQLSRTALKRAILLLQSQFTVPAQPPRPLTPQQTEEQCVLCLAAHKPALAEITLALESQTLQTADRGGVAGIDVRLEPVQVNILEG